MSDDRKKPFGGKGPRPPRDGSGAGRPAGRRPDKDRPGLAAGGTGGRKPFGKPGAAAAGAEGDARSQSRSRSPDKGFSGPRGKSGGDGRPFPAGEGREERPRGAGAGKPYRPKPEGRGERVAAGGRNDESRSGAPGKKPFGPRRDGSAPGAAGDGRDERRPGAARGRAFAPKRDAGAGRSAPRNDRPRAEAPEAAAGERIAKRLARVGIASRRDAEELIAAGRVKVNGRVLDTPAFNVREGDRIELDGTEIPPIERTRLFLFHKPGGLVTTSRDPEGRRTVFDALPEGLPRLMTVGRLDINTEGLLLLTNDGGLARVLELPATGWLRRYRVRVHGKVEQAQLDALKDGIAVDGVFYGSVEATLDREQGSNAWLTIGLREGKNREVKNILGALGLEVSRLIRISFGPFQLGELGEGHVLEVKGRTLRDQLGERLIEESGANFEADIATPFSNRPVRADRKAQPPQDETKPRRRDSLGPEGEGGLIKRRRFDRQDSREKALGRLTTQPAGKKGPKGRKGDREERTPEPKRGRSANVWMAPGARPQGRAKPPGDAEGGPDRGAKGDRPPRSKPATGGGRTGGSSSDGPRPVGDRPPRGPRSGPGGRGDANRRR